MHQGTIDLSSLPDGQLGESTYVAIMVWYTYYNLFSFCLSLLSYVFVENSHLASLMKVLNPIVEWIKLGVYLGVSHAKLKKIEKEQREQVDNCKQEMLVAWLNSSENTTKQDLKSALSNITS